MTESKSNQTPAGAVQAESGAVVPAGTPASGEVVPGGPPPQFAGATIGSATGFEGTRGFGSTSPAGQPERPAHATEQPAGAQDTAIPVHTGNAHLIIGAAAPATKVPTEAVVGGPGTDNPSAGLTRTTGAPESAVAPIEQVGNTVILPETKADDTRDPHTGLPKPRTDVDADPHEVTTPGFQGLDRINPLPPSVPTERAIEHRGNPNEPRVTGVTSVGDPPVRVIGSESDEAKAIHGGASPEEAQRETQQPSGPKDSANDASKAAAVDDDDEDTTHAKRGRLPDDFPHRGFLEGAGEATYAKIRKRIEAGTLQKIPGIGDERAAAIEEAMKE